MSLPGRVLLTSIKSPRFIAQLTDILSRINLEINGLLSGEAVSITSTDTANWDTAFSWGDHASAGYMPSSYFVSNPLIVGTASPPTFSLDTKGYFTGNGAGTAGRTAIEVRNTNTTSGSRFLLTNYDDSKHLIFSLYNPGYTLPNLAALGTDGNTPFYFITDSNVSSGGTSNVYFRLGGYSAAADAFTFDYRVRLGVGVTNPNFDISFNGNSSRIMGPERHTTANTAGNDFQIIAGGATSGATDKNGGSLILRSGTSTGTGESGVKIQTAVSGASGTANRLTTNVMVEALGDKLAFNGATPVTKPTVTGSRGGNAALASLLTALANLGLITDSTTA